MLEMIFRINDQNPDAEIYVTDAVKKKEYFKAIKIKDLVSKLNDLLPHSSELDPYKNLVVFDDDLIAVSPVCVVCKQPEHKRIVTYAGKAYKINFPNSIYMITHNAGKIISIKAYCYKAYLGAKTKLYRYGMPNMLSGNTICMGSAPKEIEVKDYKTALERVIFTQYTHAKPDNVKKFQSTSEYFEYLMDNPYPYEQLYAAGKQLKDILKKAD